MVTQIYKMRSEIWVAPPPSRKLAPKNIEISAQFRTTSLLIANISGTQQDNHRQSENGVAHYVNFRTGKLNSVYFGLHTTKNRTGVLTHQTSGHQAGHCHASSHRRAVAQHCINGDSLIQWRRAKFDPPQNGDPWTDCQKIWHSWLRPGDDPLYQISCKSVHGGLLGKGVKYNRIFFYLYLFFRKLTYRSDRLMDFHAQWLKRRGLTLLGLQSPKSLFNTWKITKKVKNWPDMGQIFRPNTACMIFP